MLVSEAMVQSLLNEGVEVLFGYPGAAICPFYDALKKTPIRHILVRTEQNAGHAAGGYARISGKCGVCIATSGPGATNLISGIASAYMDSVPLVVITGQVDSHLLGRDVFQEVDTTGMVEPFIKHSYLLKNPADTCRVFKEAFYIARSGRPGPVLIDVPVDVQLQETTFSYPEEVSIRSYKPSSYGHKGQIRRAAEAIRHADRPLLVAGGGVFSSGAQETLEELFWKARIPAVHTMMGIGALPSGYGLRLGMIGIHGGQAANLALSRADLLVLAGTRVGDRAIPSPELLARDKKVIHMDIDPAEIGKNIPADIPVVGDLRLILGQLCEELSGESRAYPDWEREVLHYKDSAHALPHEREKLDPRAVLRTLSDRMEPGSILAADVGQNQIWAVGSFNVLEGRFLTSGGMGTMGCAIPAAMGAKIACPEKQVIAVCGDGSFQMSMMELATLRQHRIPVKILVFANQRLGMVAEYQREYESGETAVSLDGSPDFVKLAEAYGIPGRQIDREEEIAGALDALLEAEGSFLLEVRVDPEEPTLPSFD